MRIWKAHVKSNGGFNYIFFENQDFNFYQRHGVGPFLLSKRLVNDPPITEEYIYNAPHFSNITEITTDDLTYELL